MATSKTLAPTGVTVQIPAMTDAPDMAVPANAIDKTIDAVNALDSKIADFMIYNLSNGGTNFPATLTVPNNSRHLILINGPYASRGRAVFLVNANASGTVQAVKIGGDDSVVATPGSNSLVISDTNGSTTTSLFTVLTSLGSKITI